jgi:hypothetical protein
MSLIADVSTPVGGRRWAARRSGRRAGAHTHFWRLLALDDNRFDIGTDYVQA